ncbi:RNI-like protein [Lepidopterella palustris CBS 459.81]|uniref:RNI-like protein n=1 Tax=Lepidopterella palustris CBS 459.81 TaxID=1314670 RepID=A0A8E2EB78_9PEZI|nr:RNI-like protein [Lepidopterella palustris CBS 459.81]
MCPRKIMNIDPNRDRCLVPELDQSKLRRVAFCVDVEIAGGPRYKDELDPDEKKKKRKDKRLRERGEGEALKHPEAIAEEKDKTGAVQVSNEVVGTEDAPNPEGVMLDQCQVEPNKKKEKKKRSEAERKERKEKKHDEAPAVSNGSPAVSGTSTPKVQDRPTTDPLRIYRRCCQLRETPILKRISDQLLAPSSCSVAAPGIVTCLDLTGSRLQLADVITLGDWLAVVPVKRLLLEDSDLTDEMTRVILAGLLSAKYSEGPKRRSWAKDDHTKIEERTGVVEKLSLKNNPKITSDGWKHISLFIYMCKSLKAIDVSMIPFPQPTKGPTIQIAHGMAWSKATSTTDIADILCKAISERLAGSRLEELIMAECSLTAQNIRKIIDGVTISGIQRLGLAGNDIDSEGLDHVIRYVRSGVCHGLDLGGNDLREGIDRLCEALSKSCPLWALSLADCDLTPDSLKPLFPALGALPNFRFLDLSHNRDLFSTPSPTSLCILRKYIPQMKDLKRLHLLDVSLSPAEAIGLAEVLPECPKLAHLNILENPQISALSTASDESDQEEACALYASLMAAVRVSDTIICIDVDVPGAESSEVVKALAKQVVAYCLRNMQRITEVPELGVGEKEVEVPEVLMHLVGHWEGFSENHDDDDPAPDDDYIVGGTGVVKALSYCLSQKESDLRRRSLSASGTVTPRGHVDDREGGMARAKIMSRNLLESARNIRARLQPALVREARAGNEMAYRRLLFLDQTLQGMIARFEDEYPECRLPSTETTAETESTHSTQSSTSPLTSAAPTFSMSPPETQQQESDEEPKLALRSRHNSDVSLASRALSLEEGRIHRLGQRVRNEILNNSRPTSSSGTGDRHTDSHPPSPLDDDQMPPHLRALQDKLYNLTGEQMREYAETKGWEETLHVLGQNAEELQRLEHEAPEEFKRFREAQIAALANAGKRKERFEIGAKDDDNDVAVED